MRALRRFTVRLALPQPLAPLGELVMNLRWSWHPQSLDLFRSVDPQTWDAVGQDPVRLLGEVSPERLAELAAREAVAPPTLTRIVAALVELGLVERQPDPEDARAALITTTAAGRAALQQVREERTAFLVDRLHALAGEDRSRLIALVSLLEELAEAPAEP